jgi:hypothetical protein
VGDKGSDCPCFFSLFLPFVVVVIDWIGCSVVSDDVAVSI